MRFRGDNQQKFGGRLMSRRFAVIGNPIKHSLSPIIHEYFGQHTGIELTYDTLEGDELNFEQQVLDFFSQNGRGLNVTLPFKQRAQVLAQQSTPRAQLAGAANTLWMKDNQLWADNTDGVGLVRDLTRFLKLQGKRIVILGAGGAARGIINPLLEARPASLTVANRTLEKCLDLQIRFPQIQCVALEQLGSDYDVIINATSAQFKKEPLQLPSDCLIQKPLCYDLSYKRKEPTAFVRFAQEFGCEAVDGLGMLVEQAAESFYLWNDVMPSKQHIGNLLHWLQS